MMRGVVLVLTSMVLAPQHTADASQANMSVANAMASGISVDDLQPCRALTLVGSLPASERSS
jgi:hypothetical protein